jgi:quinol-cytochrome oxidoreductase complex cytochrome b subunit
MLRQLVVVLLTLAVVVTLAAFFPRPFAPPADPFALPHEVPALGLGAAILVGAGRLPGGLGLILLPLLLVALAGLPLVVQTNEQAFSRRPVAMGLFLLFLLLLLVSLVAGLGPGAGASMGGVG